MFISQGHRGGDAGRQKSTGQSSSPALPLSPSSSAHDMLCSPHISPFPSSLLLLIKCSYSLSLSPTLPPFSTQKQRNWEDKEETLLCSEQTGCSLFSLQVATS
uniref:Uncharacterized protein n=1 Tax=Podarcis muralis TaxID=64176 RepID=A0A670IRM5_PODMU